MRHTVSVKAVKVVDHRSDLGCDVLRVIGYAYACSCGTVGRVRRTTQLARQEGQDHQAHTAATG